MTENSPDDVARAAASLSRRVSLIALGGAAIGGAAIAAVGRPSPAKAGKVGKKVKKTCKRQIGQCQTSVSSFCVGAPEGCEEALAACCGSFKGCKASAAYECIIEALLALGSPEPT